MFVLREEIKMIGTLETSRILDINLPVYDGYYWCQKIREVSKVPIIFISSRNTNMPALRRFLRNYRSDAAEH
jgi:DNA-binding response OmpR family regulator